jgi:hypothetical protein
MSAASASARSTATKPKIPSPARIAAMMREREAGIYHAEDTYNEAWLALNNMERDDVAITLLHAHKRFGVMNMRELLTQIQDWQKKECDCLPCNVRERTIGGKTVWSFVVQPKVLEDGTAMCPLSMCLGMLVSGFTYITPSKGVAELVVRALRKAE